MKKHTTDISGFTLMELLISITILSVIALLIMSALRISTKAWEKGEKNIESYQRTRTVISMMVDQIAAIRTGQPYFARNENNEEKEAYYIKGDTHSLAFVTTGNVNQRGEPQPVHLNYLIEENDDGSCVILKETDVPIIASLDNNTIPTNEKSTVLIPTCQDAYFEYLKSVTERKGEVWQETWGPVDDTGMPLAVRITLLENEATHPIRALARIVRDPTLAVKYDYNVN